MHALLFLLTLFSVTVAGTLQRGVDPLASLASLAYLRLGLPFSATLMTILGVHEFGHYVAARHWGVRSSLPYFLPFPYVSLLGTLGAVIRIRSPIPHRRALLDIGAAGPLAGLVVAVIACAAGLRSSQVVDVASVTPGTSIQLGSPLLFQGLVHLLAPAQGPTQSLMLGPVAFAGWVGLFITAFNLIPMGQLDGGHVVYALFGAVHAWITRALFIILLAMGVYGIFSMIWGWAHGWPGWLVLLLFLALFGRNHPPPMFPYIQLDPVRRGIGYLCLASFVLCIAPAPFSYVSP